MKQLTVAITGASGAIYGARRLEAMQAVSGWSTDCAQHAGLDERTFQKIILQCRLPHLGVQHLQVDRRLVGTRLAAEHVGRLG